MGQLGGLKGMLGGCLAHGLCSENVGWWGYPMLSASCRNLGDSRSGVGPSPQAQPPAHRC